MLKKAYGSTVFGIEAATITVEVNIDKRIDYHLSKRKFTIFALHKIHLFLVYIPKTLKIEKVPYMENCLLTELKMV